MQLSPSKPNNETGHGAEWHDSRPPWVKPPAPFITISRESSAGGSALASLLAGKLGDPATGSPPWSIYGGNIINQMLQDHHLPEELARFLPEDRVPEVRATIGEIVGRHPSLWNLVQKAAGTMRQLARDGQVIFVGRGANFATAGLAGGVRVRLVAPVDYRAQFYARRFGVTFDAAVAHNARCDAARRRYVTTYFDADAANPAAYDLVINTARVPLAEAADMIMAHLRVLTPAAA